MDSLEKLSVKKENMVWCDSSDCVKKHLCAVHLSNKEISTKPGDVTEIGVVCKNYEKFIKYGKFPTMIVERAEEPISETQYKIKVMKASVEGKTIQVRSIAGIFENYDEAKLELAWRDTPNPLWNWEKMDYRIKPEPKLRPFTYEEALTHLGKVIVSHKYGEKAKLITACAKDVNGKVQIQGITAEQFMKEFTFLDGSPCGVVEEES